MSSSNPLSKVNRELKKYRNLPGEGWLMGVCSGLSYRLGVPTWILRIAFLLTLFVFGTGLFAYLLIGIFAPSAGTPSDYYRRTGDGE